ncbi:MAG: hypothetical protein ACOX5N_01105 [Bacilli bacterium]|jgi:hypothetical protein
MDLWSGAITGAIVGDIHGYCQVQTANLPIMPDFVPDKAPDKAFKVAEYKDFVYRNLLYLDSGSFSVDALFKCANINFGFPSLPVSTQRHEKRNDTVLSRTLQDLKDSREMIFKLIGG